MADGIQPGATKPTPALPESSNTVQAGLLLEGLAALPEKALLDQTRLARLLRVTPRTVRRMIGRHELPPAVRMAGRAMWFAGRVLAHIEEAADRAARDNPGAPSGSPFHREAPTGTDGPRKPNEPDASVR